MSRRPSVYLAGPITGLSFGEATDWREYAIQQLSAAGIDAFSPLRAKTYLKQESNLADQYSFNPLSTAHGIVTRDLFDAMGRDLLLVNFLGATKVSIGTVMEIAWADACRKPIVIAMEPGKVNPHEHSMLTEVSGYIVPTLDEAIYIAIKVLLP
jgi:nucleoside 2-deoxyribosyltransferase